VAVSGHAGNDTVGVVQQLGAEAVVPAVWPVVVGVELGSHEVGLADDALGCGGSTDGLVENASRNPRIDRAEVLAVVGLRLGIGLDAEGDLPQLSAVDRCGQQGHCVCMHLSRQGFQE
jgi:hypothetical protein